MFLEILEIVTILSVGFVMISCTILEIIMIYSLCYQYLKPIKKKKEECGICLEYKLCIITNCGHCFDKKCLETWKEIKNECPLCRRWI
jgi:hypothetical protein